MILKNFKKLSWQVSRLNKLKKLQKIRRLSFPQLMWDFPVFFWPMVFFLFFSHIVSSFPCCDVSNFEDTSLFFPLRSSNINAYMRRIHVHARGSCADVCARHPCHARNIRAHARNIDAHARNILIYACKGGMQHESANNKKQQSSISISQTKKA